VKNWFARHPCFHVHFTPTSASWLNQVERWFATLTEKHIDRPANSSATRDYLHNCNAEPFVWTKSADAHSQQHGTLLPATS
jgi:hypothetical protein